VTTNSNNQELKELYEEYRVKTDAEMLVEIKELKAGGGLSKKEAKDMKEMPGSEKKRVLFTRILVIVMEAEDEDEDDNIGDDDIGDGDAEDDDDGPVIDEDYIAGLTEEQCAPTEAAADDEAEAGLAGFMSGGNLAGWVCGLPTSDLKEMCEARGLEAEAGPDGARLPLVQALLRGMLEVEAALSSDDDDDDDDDDDEDDDEEDDEEEEAEEAAAAAPAAKKAKN